MIDISLIHDLYYISHISTIPSIFKKGILCHNQVSEIKHESVASPIIQQRRENKQIPGGMKLHDYANLYLDAHNPMLSKIRDQNNEIAILQIGKTILLLKDVIICDRNASSDYAAFYPVETGLNKLNFQMIYDRYWTNHPDSIQLVEHKSIKCAEALIPYRVPAEYIIGIIVYDNTAKTHLESMEIQVQITVEKGMFF